MKKKVASKKLAAKFDPKDKYSFYETVLSDRVIYFFKKGNMVDYAQKFYLPFSKMDYYEDRAVGANILKITKQGEAGLLLAFKSKEQAKQFAEVLVKHVPSIETQNDLKMH